MLARLLKVLILASGIGCAHAEPGTAAPPAYDAALEALVAGNEREAVRRLWHIIETDPGHAGAWLDLGLIYCDNGMAAAAARIFEHIERRFDPAEAIRQLIELVRARGCRPLPPPAPPYRFQAGLRVGHDSNPNFGLAADSLTLRINGTPTPVELTAASRPQPSAWSALNLLAEASPAPGWRLHAVAGLADYRNGGDHDQRRLLLAASHTAGPAYTSAWLSHTWLGGEAYQSVAGLRHRHQLGAGWEADVVLQRLHYPGRSVLDGWTLEPRLGYRIELPGEGMLLVAAGPHLDRPDASDRPGGRRTGGAVQLDLVQPLPGGWRLEAFARAQRLVDADAYSPLFGDTRRRQRLGLLSLSLSRPVGRDARCGLQYQALDSRDPIPVFSYRQHIASLGCEYEFK